MIKKEPRRRFKNNYLAGKCDIDGWFDANECKPPPYELVVLKTKNKTAVGWYEGYNWFSIRMGKYPKVLYWKRTPKNLVGGPKND